MASPQKPAPRNAAPAKQAVKPAAQVTRPAATAKPAPVKAAQPAPVAQKSTPPAKASESKSQSNAVAVREDMAVAIREDVPEYIRGSAGRGSENVAMEDMVIPRIELVQALSKCLEEGSGEYIEGAKAGMFYNSVTRMLYGSSVIVCPVFFKKQFLSWRSRKVGGGFGGAYDTMQEAQENIGTREDPDNWEAVETAQQIVLVIDPDTQEMSEAVLSCARTKQKVSRQWNSLIRVNGFDRFSRLYELFGTDETNSRNDSYKNIGVRYVDWANMDVYKRAEDLYNSIASGARAVKIDDTYIDATAEDQPAPGAASEDPGPAEY